GGREFKTVPTVANSAGNVGGGISPHPLRSAQLRTDPRVAPSLLQAAETPPQAPPTHPKAPKGKSQPIYSNFKSAADALFPTAGVGTPWAANAASRATEFYGGRPELDLHAAAHMALNLIDMFDTNGTPTVQTLLVSRGANTFCNANSSIVGAAFPTWQRNTNG